MRCPGELCNAQRGWHAAFCFHIPQLLLRALQHGNLPHLLPAPAELCWLQEQGQLAALQLPQLRSPTSQLLTITALGH